jgi:hypothetical protein
MAAYTTINDPSAYFKVQLYTGDGSTPSITFDDTDTDMQPDLVWIKNRDATDSHCLFDAVRGATEVLHADAITAEVTDADSLTSFDSDGFALGADVKVNTNTEDYVSWNWKESATAGLDIVSYTGNGTDDTDISHNLSATPNLIMVKNRDAADAWQVYHHKNTSAPETDYMVLDTTAATVDAADRWSDEAPTSSVFTLGDGAKVNTNTENYIAYCFAEKQGFSKFGSYTGNGNTDGAFVYTGLRPAWIMIKRTDVQDNWNIYDSKRGFNPDTAYVKANATTAEASDVDIDILSNGWKCRTADAAVNVSGATYVYAAFAEAPFVNSNGVPCNAR